MKDNEDLILESIKGISLPYLREPLTGYNKKQIKNELKRLREYINEYEAYLDGIITPKSQYSPVRQDLPHQQ